MIYTRRRGALGALMLLALVACGEDQAQSPTGTTEPIGDASRAGDVPLAWAAVGKRADLLGAVRTWNDYIMRFGTVGSVPPPIEARAVAMASTTMHDVLNAVRRRAEGYAYTGQASEPLSVEAAIAAGVRDVLVAVGAEAPFDPQAAADIEEAYTSYLANIPDGVEKDRGVALGGAAAAAMLAKRAGDGASGPVVTPYLSTGEPGKFRPLAGPAAPIGLAGVGALMNWGNVRPFVLTSPSQFRAPPPYGAASVQAAVQTPLYLADYAEVKAYGGVTSSVRTPDQTDLAFFWVESSTQGWNEAARVIAAQRHLDAWKLARLLAHVHLAQADAYIAVFDNKNFDEFWRPVTAIRLWNLDPATPGDPTWDVLSSTVAAIGGTPIIPDYVSGHAGAGGAGGEAIKANVPGQVKWSMTSGTSQSGQPRSWHSIDQAIRENSDSRVFVGFHFRHATVMGEAQGRAVGRYVAANSLAKVDDE
jgi:hypothetical protein